MGKIFVIGSSNTDMVVRTSKMPAPGETVLGKEFEIIPGGKGANQAVAAARAGGEVIFVARVGNDDFGNQAIQGYKEEKVRTDHILRDEDFPTGVAVIIVDEMSGENSIVVAPGANGQMTHRDIKRIEPIISKDDLLVAQLEIPIDCVEAAFSMAKQKWARTILDPAPVQVLSDSLLGKVDILTPNLSEAEGLLNKMLDSDKAIESGAKELLKKVNKAVLITLGNRGVYYATKSGGSGFIEPVKVVPVDTTAAGDVFNGYLAAGLAGGDSLQQAIAKANIAAAISVTRRGAQPSIPYKEEVL